jgi:hypothetical protein
MKRLKAALLELHFVIQCKKSTVMPANYLSRLPSTNTSIIAEVTECFDTFQAEIIDLQQANINLQHMNDIISDIFILKMNRAFWRQNTRIHFT